MTSARDKRHWIVNGANGDLRAGIYRVQPVKGGPWFRVRLTEDGSGEIDAETGAWVWTSDVTYRLEYDGEVIANPRLRFLKQGLIGEEISEAEFQFMKATAEHEAKYGPAPPPAPPPRLPVIDPMTVPPPF